ncbi:HAD family hydrolase [Sedimentisphaera salicampi]|uniref:HAD family hydrolase n=1 Tax=Sedimentisphaera salicampi TaxID=1941349 RepID=UPI000B9D47F5|nr:HAD family phosphatase [Sedimentisphaera salicampi]OXU15961.1 HAD hydrolase [Sedimentisphaera salicampi]
MREFNEIVIPDLGSFGEDSGLQKLDICSDGRFAVGSNGVQTIAATGDGKVEFIAFENKSIAFVRSSMGYPAYYPVEPAGIDKPLKAVLMDLDGTSVRSESFWIWIIQQTTASLLGNPNFELEDEDLPYVSGHSVSEHLKYCVNKYCPDKSVEQAREFYFKHTHEEMELIVQGRGRKDAFTPSPGIKEFLLKLKEANLKIGLVTSGLYEKAWPEILSAFRQLDMPDPKNFYDAIITAGFPLRKGSAGTLGELSPKPHPWLYAEVARVGLGLEPSERRSVIGIEDSGAGVCSIRLAGFAAFGLADGNIIESGTKALCEHYCDNFEEIESLIL